MNNFRLLNRRFCYYEQALWSQFNNLHRVCIKLSSLINKSLKSPLNVQIKNLTVYAYKILTLTSRGCIELRMHLIPSTSPRYRNTHKYLYILTRISSSIETPIIVSVHRDSN